MPHEFESHLGHRYKSKFLSVFCLVEAEEVFATDRPLFPSKESSEMSLDNISKLGEGEGLLSHSVIPYKKEYVEQSYMEPSKDNSYNVQVSESKRKNF
jgi:hypothetical protein